MTINNQNKKDKIIRKIDEHTSDMQSWPSWKKDINLTDASTFTVNASNNNNYPNSNQPTDASTFTVNASNNNNYPNSNESTE